jgi:hypothetical protein
VRSPLSVPNSSRATTARCVRPGRPCSGRSRTGRLVGCA